MPEYALAVVSRTATKGNIQFADVGRISESTFILL